jgi:hypothetical protein
VAYGGRPRAVARGRLLSGEIKAVAAILEQSAIEKVFAHLDLAARAPPLPQARGQTPQAISVRLQQCRPW